MGRAERALRQPPLGIRAFFEPVVADIVLLPPIAGIASPERAERMVVRSAEIEAAAFLGQVCHPGDLAE